MGLADGRPFFSLDPSDHVGDTPSDFIEDSSSDFMSGMVRPTLVKCFDVRPTILPSVRVCQVRKTPTPSIATSDPSDLLIHNNIYVHYIRSTQDVRSTVRPT